MATKDFFRTLCVFAIGAMCVSISAQTGIKGKVRTNRGDGIAGAQIIVRKDGKDLTKATANRAGEFQIVGLESGKYNIVFDAQGYSSGVLYNVEVKRDSIRDLGSKLVLNVDQGTLVIIRGSVFFKEGTTVSGAKIEVERIGENGTKKKIASGFSNSLGEFSIRQPGEPATYRITVSYKGSKSAKEIRVEQAAVYHMAISLELSQPTK